MVPTVALWHAAKKYVGAVARTQQEAAAAAAHARRAASAEVRILGSRRKPRRKPPQLWDLRSTG